jgi:hypothetical protein
LFLDCGNRPFDPVHTGESALYPSIIDKDFAAHETVNHGKKEYARGDVTTNFVEGYFSVVKRGMTGVYQHCSAQHFQRYLYEFTFRHNNRSKLGVENSGHAVRATKAMNGRRLTYWRICQQGEGPTSAAF